MGASVQEAQPAMFRIETDVRRIIRETFESQGRRGGGSWEFISDDWRHRKLREGRDPRILYYTHRLINSLVNEGGENIAETTGTDFKLGTSVPYAELQNRKRPFMKVTRYDTARWKDWVAEWIKRNF